jgi:hypothetical protein
MAAFGSIAANSNFGQMTGTAAADDAAAGNIGEQVISAVGLGSGPSLTSPNPSNVTSIALTAGDWDITGQVVFEFTSATQSGDSTASLSGVSATLKGDSTDGYNGQRLTTTTCKQTIALPAQRVTTASSPTMYLVAQAIFSAGSCKASGFIRARRIR